MKKIALLIVCSLCTSCGIYQSEFDCPAGKGTCCKSVNEVLNMIVEKENEEDLFIQDEEMARSLKEKEKQKNKAKVILEKEKDPNKLYLLKESTGQSALIIQERP